MLLQGHQMVADRRRGLLPLVAGKGKRPSRVVCWRHRHHSSDSQSCRVSRGLVYDENGFGKQGENDVLHCWQPPVNAYSAGAYRATGYGPRLSALMGELAGA